MANVFTCSQNGQSAPPSTPSPFPPELLKHLANFNHLSFPPPPPPPPPFAGAPLPFVPHFESLVTAPRTPLVSDHRAIRAEAKASIADMVSAGLTYQDLVNEGLSARVLDMFFEELQLKRDVEQRKDKIAKMLAARKSKVATSTAGSTPRTTPQPSRDSRPSKGPEIPGLFLTDAEEVPMTFRESSIPEMLTHPDPPEPEETAMPLQEVVLSVLPTSTDEGEKESNTVPPEEATMLETSIHSHTVTSQKVSLPVQEPTIPGVPLHPIPGLNEDVSVPLQEHIIPEVLAPSAAMPEISKSKINQDKLKDRMAALKADLLRKNSRKKDLQDGMPALAAELEKTRERLQEQQTELTELRETIELKATELARARETEARLVSDISKLEAQLADGEDGQKQFSSELNQLNDQIATTSEQSTTVVTPEIADTNVIMSDEEAAAPEGLVKSPTTSFQDVIDSQPGDADAIMSDQESDVSLRDATTKSDTTSSYHPSRNATPADGVLLDEQTHSDDGSVSMSDSESDYEPPGQVETIELTVEPEVTFPVENLSAAAEPLGHSSTSTTHFVPYHSPLASLKSFRFNPQFKDVVKNGYRSLTYSNQIDAVKPVCPTELEGKQCTDVDCEEQHFGSMILSDDKILVQMSSANGFEDKKLRDSYLLGLKQVIADLRGRGVKEFTEVASALSRYRREWAAQNVGQY